MARSDQLCQLYSLSVDEDKVIWSLNKNGVFSTKSMYNFLGKDLAGASYSWIWKANIPLKIQIFMCQLFQNAVLTRDNMTKRNWPGSPVCSFCDGVESLITYFSSVLSPGLCGGRLGVFWVLVCVRIIYGRL